MEVASLLSADSLPLAAVPLSGSGSKEQRLRQQRHQHHQRRKLKPPVTGCSSGAVIYPLSALQSEGTEPTLAAPPPPGAGADATGVRPYIVNSVSVTRAVSQVGLSLPEAVHQAKTQRSASREGAFAAKVRGRVLGAPGDSGPASSGVQNALGTQVPPQPQPLPPPLPLRSEASGDSRLEPSTATAGMTSPPRRADGAAGAGADADGGGGASLPLSPCPGSEAPHRCPPAAVASAMTSPAGEKQVEMRVRGITPSSSTKRLSLSEYDGAPLGYDTKTEAQLAELGTRTTAGQVSRPPSFKCPQVVVGETGDPAARADGCGGGTAGKALRRFGNRVSGALRRLRNLVLCGTAALG
jgi:hypothetical protein